MQRRARKIRILLAALVFAFTALAASPAVAASSPPPPPRPSGPNAYPSYTGMSLPPTTSGGATAATASSSLAPGCSTYPYGQYSLKPWRTTSLAKGYAYIQCSIEYKYLDIAQALYREHWYGWQEIDYASDFTYYNTYIDAPTYADCYQTGNYNYDDPASGEAITMAGHAYYGNTSATSNFTC